MKKKVAILNISRNETILEEAEIADTFSGRLKGLLGRKSLPLGTGLIIKPCQAVHTVGMSFPIDVAFVDRENRICLLLDNLPPWRFSPAVRQASYVIEAPAGTFRQKQLAVGDELRIVGV